MELTHNNYMNYILENKKISTMIYNLEEEIENELNNYNNNIEKDSGEWKAAKMIIQHSNIDTARSVWLLDILEPMMALNNESFDDVKNVYYKNDLDVDHMYVFDKSQSKYLIENLKLPEYKPNGIIFNSDNKWDFHITIVTDKNVYCANRYISDGVIGMY